MQRGKVWRTEKGQRRMFSTLTKTASLEREEMGSLKPSSDSPAVLSPTHTSQGPPSPPLNNQPGMFQSTRHLATGPFSAQI